VPGEIQPVHAPVLVAGGPCRSLSVRDPAADHVPALSGRVPISTGSVSNLDFAGVPVSIDLNLRYR